MKKAHETNVDEYPVTFSEEAANIDGELCQVPDALMQAVEMLPSGQRLLAKTLQHANVSCCGKRLGFIDLMSASGHEQTSRDISPMSALSPRRHRGPWLRLMGQFESCSRQ